MVQSYIHARSLAEAEQTYALSTMDRPSHSLKLAQGTTISTLLTYKASGLESMSSESQEEQRQLRIQSLSE